VPPPGKRSPGVGFSEAHFAETRYYVESGLRKVVPYYFDFQTYCKGRWVGKSLLQVFSSEFRAEPVEYYRAAAQLGRIRLNGEPVTDLGIILKDNDFMRNTVHRHEPPVTAQPIEILAENAEVVVVDKPASLPVHPCGRFRHNTVIFILGKEHHLKELHTIHRLDRMTSGVLMFAKTLEVSNRIHELVRERQLEKEYVCRVQGEFAEEEITCEEPILVVSYKVGVCRVHPSGKPCKTVFQRLSYNGRSSVVRCFPYTGRTHQIRVHLQFLGHPIVNDPIYNTEAWGPERGKGGKIEKTNEELLEALVSDHRIKESLDLEELMEKDLKKPGEHKDVLLVPAVESSAKTDTSAGDCQKTSEVRQEQVPRDQTGEAQPGSVQGSEDAENSAAGWDRSSASEREKTSALAKDPLCGECKLVRKDPSPKDLIMYLHALRYKGPDFEYSTKMPAWALEDWQED
uniref:Pseudouridine synthase n=2 Tax=Latimeria chalumnae TaxID=7897 RepID=H3BCU7_LATCH